MSSLAKHRYESAKEALEYEMVFLSMAKENFYLRTRISAYVIKQGKVPISPFMNIDYNLGGTVEKRIIRVAENTMLQRCKQLWVFGDMSDGMLVEIFLAKKNNIPVRYFSLPDEQMEVRELEEDEVSLSGVSKWVWDWVREGKNLERWHPRLRIKNTYPLIYPAYSKRSFYLQAHISKYCLERRAVPLNPFMIFRYFLNDSVVREGIYKGNASIIANVDELWTFGPLSDGVIAEIELAKEREQEIKHFKIVQDKPTVEFRKIPVSQVVFEEKELEKYRDILE
jgi:hypothetical protein